MPSLNSIPVFERAVALAIAGAVIVTAMIVVLGDNVGVQITRFGPEGVASSSSVVSVQFTEQMNRASVEERLEITPPIPGEVSWNGSRLLFRPEDGFQPDRQYSVSIEDGAESASGRDLLEKFEFSFHVRGAQIAYLSEIDKEIWIADPSGVVDQERVSFTTGGVAFFDVSPDGASILFRERGELNPQLMMLDLSGGLLAQLTFIEGILISSAAWNYDGSMIAFTSSDEGPLVPGPGDSPVVVSPPRVSILNLASGQPVISRLLRSSLEYSDDPRWSPAGNMITVGVTPLTLGEQERLTVVDLDSGPLYLVETDRPGTVTFSEDGNEFMVIVRTGIHVKSPTEIWRIEVDTGRLEQVVLADDFDSVRDSDLAWRPGHPTVAVMREATNSQDLPTTELHLIDLTTGVSTPLLTDSGIDVLDIEWSPSGSLLAVDLERTEGSESVRQISILDVDSNETVNVLANASGATWVP